MVLSGEIPDFLKTGLVSPIFKKKGDKHEVKNYRGITVLPVLLKILEYVVREKMRPVIDPQQSVLQRGFTKNTSPMNCSLIVEEFVRESKDCKQIAYIALLDAKSAFDVVNHDHLMRKLYHMGVENELWKVINNLHRNAPSSIKWGGHNSETFPINLGVRQGGILSADLYKVHINTLLQKLQNIHIGINMCR